MNTKESRLDLDRRHRIGMIEAVWGEHKSIDQIASILNTFLAAGEVALVTRVSPLKGEELTKSIKNSKYHPKAQFITLGEPINKNTFPSPGFFIPIFESLSSLKFISSNLFVSSWICISISESFNKCLVKTSSEF